MRTLARAARLVAHVALGAVSLVWLACTRRGSLLLLTHAPDLDDRGVDEQLGPLVDRLLERRTRFAEVTFVTLDGGLLRNLRAKRRPFVSLAVVLGAARLWSAVARRDLHRARLDAGRQLLRALRPAAVIATDESGSGQTLVRAARSLGVRTVGVQHGDFQPANRQYAFAAGERPTEPVDTLCVWSEWFRARLLAVSPIYTRANTRVTGRLRRDGARPAPEPADALRVLYLSEADPAVAAAVAPFLDALRSEPGIELRVRPHPAEPGGRWPAAEREEGGLARALARAHAVAGVGSSALLEALHHGVPGVLLAPAGVRDPAGYAASGAFELCDRAADVGRICRSAARTAPAAVDRAREAVWGGAPVDPVGAVLEAATGLPEAAVEDRRPRAARDG